MTTGDEEADRLVDDLFREVDDQFDDLEREYRQAREQLASTAPGSTDTPSNALGASHERFELMSQVASLQAELSRQRDELDERDRMLTELGDKIAGFEADIAKRDEMLTELRAAKQEALDERREQARLTALLDARAAERQELADVTHRLQNERDNVKELLTTALSRFDEAEAAMAQMDDKVRHLEAARDTAAREHDSRAHELIESRAEMSKLTDQLAELARNAAAADQRAEKAEALAERRTNEAGYLNRRIDTMNDKIAASSTFEDEAKNLRRELTLSERRINELERELGAAQSEAAAANAAVDAIAARTADNEELAQQVVRLEHERDAAWEAASARRPGTLAALEPGPENVSALADRARELGGRRASEAELAANAAEEAASLAAASRASASEASSADAESASAGGDDATEPSAAAEASAMLWAAGVAIEHAESEASAASAPAEGGGEADGDEDVDDLDDLEDLDADDVELIESDLADLVTPPAAITDFAGTNALPRIDLESLATGTTARPSEVAQRLEQAADAVSDADAAADGDAEAEADAGPVPVAPSEPEVIPLISLDHLDDDDTPRIAIPEAPAARKRTILPAALVPNTPEAVAHLLNQPGVTAIVDARSTCGRTGIRPSELFARIEKLRDQFDVPVEVVVTPVSTPVGGAPDLPAIGVHHVTGADTVADRIRALCKGLPADQPLVVIAGDDHVRRAAIGEEANVLDPGAVLNLPAD